MNKSTYTYSRGDTISIEFYSGFIERFVVIRSKNRNMNHNILYSLTKKRVTRMPSCSYRISRVLLIEKRNLNSPSFEWK